MTAKPIVILLVAMLWPAAYAAVAAVSNAANNPAYSPVDNAAETGVGGAGAADTPSSMFSFGGFGTLGLTHSSEVRADFRPTLFQPNGAGYSNEWSADVDSLLAAQITATVTPRLSAVVQVISQQKYDNTYWPHVEWANIKYEFTPDFSIRVGRTAMPVFLLTDSRKIGYASPWVRPPSEIYSTMVPVTINDGFDASYRMSLGAATNTLQVNAGRSDVKYPSAQGISGGTGKARKQIAFVDTFESGFLTVHVTYFVARLTAAALNPLFDAFRQFGPQGISIAEKYSLNDRLLHFVGVGTSYDPGKWFATGEWGHVNTHSILGENTGWYVGGGYRLGKFTPYATYAQVRPDSNTSDPGLTVSSYPAFLAGAATGLNAALNTILGAAANQQTTAVGVRWDFMRNVDAKLQIDHMRLGAGSPSLLINLQPGFHPGGTVNLFSATIDFVF